MENLNIKRIYQQNQLSIELLLQLQIIRFDNISKIWNLQRLKDIYQGLYIIIYWSTNFKPSLVLKNL